jgi:hypothetical protein
LHLLAACGICGSQYAVENNEVRQTGKDFANALF